QHDRQRGLDDDERVAETAPGSAGGVLALPSFIVSARSARARRRAGARLKITVVASAAPPVKRSTRQSIAVLPRRGMLPGFQAVSALTPKLAIARPATPLMTARTRLSVINWRTMRSAPAPSAVRNAISRCRA